jgi:hypothetical protein
LYIDKEAFQSISYWTTLKGDIQKYFIVEKIISVSEILVGRILYKFIGKIYITYVSRSVSLMGLKNVRFYFLTRLYCETGVPDISRGMMTFRELTSS